MKSLIIRTFFDYGKRFSQITKNIRTGIDQPFLPFTAISLINMSLRDEVVDHIVQDFADHMEVDFLHMDVSDAEHTRSLQDCLAHLCSQKRELEILWKQQLLPVEEMFDEMMNAGARKVKLKFRIIPAISREKNSLLTGMQNFWSTISVNSSLVVFP